MSEYPDELIDKKSITVFSDNLHTVIIEKIILEKYLEGNSILVYNDNEECMYLTALDVLLDFKNPIFEDSYFCKFKKELYPNTVNYNEFIAKLIKRMHWSWLYYDLNWFKNEFRALNAEIAVLRKIESSIPSKEVIFNALMIPIWNTENLDAMILHTKNATFNVIWNKILTKLNSFLQQDKIV